MDLFIIVYFGHKTIHKKITWIIYNKVRGRYIKILNLKGIKMCCFFFGLEKVVHSWVGFTQDFVFFPSDGVNMMILWRFIATWLFQHSNRKIWLWVCSTKLKVIKDTFKKYNLSKFKVKAQRHIHFRFIFVVHNSRL